MTKKTLKRLLVLLAVTAALVCIFAFQASAETFTGTCGTNVNWSVDTSTGVLTISGSGSMNGYAYVSPPWSEHDKLTSLTIQSGVTSIGERAFYGCTGLTSVTIPNSVTSISESAFCGCTGLTSVTIPNSATSIAKNAFLKCTGLKSISVSSGNTAFASDNGVLFDKGKTTLIIYPAAKTGTSYTIPSTVTAIDEFAFYGCSNLTNITIPNSVTSIGRSAFRGCLNLTNIAIPNSVTSIGESVFQECTGLTSVTIPGSIKKVDSYSFKGCTGLTSVVIPSGVTHIYGAFEECAGLQSVTIPESVSFIATTAFLNCKNIKYVFYTGTEAQWKNIKNNYGAVILYSAIIHYSSTDHVLTNNESAAYLKTPADCYNRAVYYYSCKYCSLVGTSTFESATPASHSWDSGTVVKAVTCTADGSATYTCTRSGCGVKETRDVEKLGHNWNSGTVGVAPTCTADGIEIYTCTRSGCSTKEIVPIEKLGHSLDSGKLEAAPTCTANGTWVFTCTRSGCGVTETETIEKLGHVFTERISEKAYLKSADNCEASAVFYYACSRCKAKGTETYTALTPLGHDYKPVTVKATTSADGYTGERCTRCANVINKKPIYKVLILSLSKTLYTYDGRLKNPSVTVKNSKGSSLKKDIDYSIKYDTNSNSVGEHKVTITFKGNYGGTKVLTFTVIPKSVREIKVSQTTSTIKATWTKVSGVTGYKVLLYKGSKLVSSKTVSGTSCTFKKLSAGTKYTVKVQAYKTVNNVNYWSNTKTLVTATKTKTPAVKSVKAGSKSATVKWNNVSGESGYEIYYSTSKKGTYKKGATAKVNKTSATVKKLKKGKTYYFKVRAYTKADSGTVYSSWSAVKSVKVVK